MIAVYEQGCEWRIFFDSHSIHSKFWNSKFDSDSRTFQKTTPTPTILKNDSNSDSDSTQMFTSPTTPTPQPWLNHTFKNLKKKEKAYSLFKICSLSCIMWKFYINFSKKVIWQRGWVVKAPCLWLTWPRFKTHSHHSVVFLAKTLHGTFPAWWSWQAVPNFSHISIKLLADSNILASPEAGRVNCLPYVLTPQSLSCESGG